MECATTTPTPHRRYAFRPGRALLTGMNAVRNGVTDNLHALRPDYNDAGIRTWPQIMAGSGYYTAAVGKMHFYPWDSRHGFQYRVVCEDKLWSLITDDYHDYLMDNGLRKLRWFEYGEYRKARKQRGARNGRPDTDHIEPGGHPAGHRWSGRRR